MLLLCHIDIYKEIDYLTKCGNLIKHPHFFGYFLKCVSLLRHDDYTYVVVFLQIFSVLVYLGAVLLFYRCLRNHVSGRAAFFCICSSTHLSAKTISADGIQ